MGYMKKYSITTNRGIIDNLHLEDLLGFLQNEVNQIRKSLYNFNDEYTIKVNVYEVEKPIEE